MRISIRAVYDIATGALLERQSYEYFGPVERLDRAAQNEAGQAAGTAGTTAAGYGANAANANAALVPFYRQEMQAQHLFNPAQTSELLNAAESPLAAGAATDYGRAQSEAARTRNTSGFSGALDEAARQRNQALGQANLGIGEADVMGAKELNQEGAAGMQGLYGTDVNAQLKAMGIQNEDINTEIQAGKSGWFQNLMNGIQTITGGVKALRPGS